MYLAVYGAFRREQCPGTKEEATSLVHERLDVRIDGVTSFERRERTAVNRRQVRLRSYHHSHHRQLRRGPCRAL